MTLLAAILISFAANIFVCLPIWLTFKELALLSVPANLILAPLSSVLLFLAQQETMNDSDANTIAHFNTNIALVALIAALVALVKG